MKSDVVIAFLVFSAFVTTEGSSKKREIEVKFLDEKDEEKNYLVNVNTGRLPFEPRDGFFHIVVQFDKNNWLKFNSSSTVIRPNDSYLLPFVSSDVEGVKVQWINISNGTQTPIYLRNVSITDTKKSRVQYFCPQPRDLAIYTQTLIPLKKCHTTVVYTHIYSSSSVTAFSVSSIIIFLVSCIVLHKTYLQANVHV